MNRPRVRIGWFLPTTALCLSLGLKLSRGFSTFGELVLRLIRNDCRHCHRSGFLRILLEDIKIINKLKAGLTPRPSLSSLDTSRMIEMLTLSRKEIWKLNVSRLPSGKHATPNDPREKSCQFELTSGSKFRNEPRQSVRPLSLTQHLKHADLTTPHTG